MIPFHQRCAMGLASRVSVRQSAAEPLYRSVRYRRGCRGGLIYLKTSLPTSRIAAEARAKRGDLGFIEVAQ